MNEEKIVQKLIEQGERLVYIEENMTTKTQFNDAINKIDQVIKIVTRIDEERIFTNSHINRIENEIEENKITLEKQGQVLADFKLKLDAK